MIICIKHKKGDIQESCHEYAEKLGWATADIVDVSCSNTYFEINGGIPSVSKNDSQ